MSCSANEAKPCRCSLRELVDSVRFVRLGEARSLANWNGLLLRGSAMRTKWAAEANQTSYALEKTGASQGEAGYTSRTESISLGKAVRSPGYANEPGHRRCRPTNNDRALPRRATVDEALLCELK